jgi:hypothetical protein
VTSDVTRVIDELYAVPPKEFSSARNATAASLKAAGHVKEAQAVRQLGKPSPSLWATNQLGRQDPEGVARFVDVVNRVRRSQLHDPRTAAEGMKTIRAELQALTNRAADVLTKAGYRISPATSARISNTVLAAAVDAGLVDDLRYGRLTAELAAPGFEVLAGAGAGRPLQLLRGGKTSDPQREPTEAKREHADTKWDQTETKRQQAKARREQAEARHAQERAERERLAQEVEALRRDAAQRKAAAEQAAQEVRELERHLAEARRKLRAAEREATAAAARARRRTDS